MFEDPIRCFALAVLSLVTWVVLARIRASGMELYGAPEWALGYGALALLESVAPGGHGPAHPVRRHLEALAASASVALLLGWGTRTLSLLPPLTVASLVLFLMTVGYRFRTGFGLARQPHRHIAVAIAVAGAFTAVAAVGVLPRALEADLGFPSAGGTWVSLFLLFISAALLTVPWWQHGESRWDRYQATREVREKIVRALEGADDVLLLRLQGGSGRRGFVVHRAAGDGAIRTIAGSEDIVVVGGDDHYVLVDSPVIVEAAGAGDDYRDTSYERLVSCQQTVDLGTSLPSTSKPPSPLILQLSFSLLHLAFASAAWFGIRVVVS